MELRDALVKKLNLSNDSATDADILAAFETMRKDIDRYKEQELTSLVDGAFKARKITATDREFYMEMGKKDVETLRKVLNKLPAFVSLEGRIGEGDKTGDRSSWKLNDWRKNAPDELRKNPALYQRLIEAESPQS